ncbi:stage II sporulation protein M [Stutzerimonas azotifigens]|uniref:stage II sporulation protein M n=1 Tax=Stutzerimonas azotifigens TaxID=291995 RepID=UPI000417B91A|nr:stage II sporulation protein M [Stutzerimonas azotifigens]
MKQQSFERRHAQEWQAFTVTLEALEANRAEPESSAAFPAAYRRLCQQLALAQARGYSSHLVDRLQTLAMRGHQQFYRHRGHPAADFLGFLLAGLPQLVRREWRSVLLASLLFYGSLLGMGGLVLAFPDLVHSVLPAEQIGEMERLYDPEARRLGRFAERGSLDDWAMFGFYVMNNIGIAFQTFASGLLLGAGTIFYLLFNGLTIGAVAGHLTAIGYHEPFWSFVIGHGAFELTAITLAGAAGLKLGAGLLRPGQLPRLESLRLAAAIAVRLVGGATLLLLVAAFVEAFWSSMTYTSASVKYAVGGLLWLLVALYFGQAGRRRHAPE